jgi:hypothetical protein
MYSVDVPPSADMTKVIAILKRGHISGTWIYQEGYRYIASRGIRAIRTVLPFLVHSDRAEQADFNGAGHTETDAGPTIVRSTVRPRQPGGTAMSRLDVPMTANSSAGPRTICRRQQLRKPAEPSAMFRSTGT